MKHLAKLAISLGVHCWDLPHEVLCRLFGRPVPPRCTVLYYHGVSAHHRTLFARQMDVLLKLAQPIALDAVENLRHGQRYAAVTFDDGFVSVLENAAPELAKRRIPWTFFIPSGRLGQNPDWLRHAKVSVRLERVLSADQLRGLASDPLVTIGSHTVSHQNLLEIQPEQAAGELARSKTELEAILGKPVQQFSYPFGARNSDVDRLARQAGYNRVFSTEPLLAFQAPGEFVTGRASVNPDTSMLEFRLKLLGAYRWHRAGLRHLLHG